MGRKAKRKQKARQIDLRAGEGGRRGSWVWLPLSLIALALGGWRIKEYVEFTSGSARYIGEHARLEWLKGFIAVAWLTLASTFVGVYVNGGWKAARKKTRLWMGVGFLAWTILVIALRELFGPEMPGAR